MKKNFVIYVILLLAVAFNANAEIDKSNTTNSAKDETKNYENKFMLGIDIGLVSTSTEIMEDDNIKINNNISLDGSAINFEPNLSYKIYLNKNSINSFFITPQISYSFAGKTKSDDFINMNTVRSYFDLEVAKTYSASVSFGLEIRKKHSFSAGFGIQGLDYNYHYSRSDGLLNVSESSSGSEFFYSIMYEYNINESFAIDLKFSGTGFELEMPNKDISLFRFGRQVGIADELEGNINTLSIGFSYRY